MPAIENFGLLAAGVVLILLAVLIMWRTSRYDLKGAAIDSAWQVARGKRSAENPTALEAKLRDIQSAPTAIGKARRAGGTVIGHFVAQVFGLAAIVMLLVGMALLVTWWFWK